MNDELKKALIEDEGLYYAWQSNIAMSMSDTYHSNKKKYKNRQDLHKIFNDGAKRFLDNLKLSPK